VSIDLYKYAAQQGLRFPSRAGSLSVEDLFQLPLTSARDANLDDTAKMVNAALKSVSEESFVTTSNPRKGPLEVALEIVKDVIATKQAENEAVRLKASRAEERRKLLDAISAADARELSSASKEDLLKKLAELDG